MRNLVLAGIVSLVLAGCQQPGGKTAISINLPEVPSDVKVCFLRLVPKPDVGVLSKAQVLQLVARLYQSDVKHTKCGRRLLNFYTNLKAR